MFNFKKSVVGVVFAAVVSIATSSTAFAEPGDRETTTIDHSDGSSSTVTSDSQGSVVENSNGGGGHYGTGYSHGEVVERNTDDGSTVRDDPDNG